MSRLRTAAWGLALVAAMGCGMQGQPGPSSGAPAAASALYLVGAGSYDITGPPVGLSMMGYGWANPRGAGIHTRLRSRAIIVGEPSGQRVALVTADLGMIFQGVQQAVLARLASDPALVDGSGAPLYHEQNVLLSATHTHGGPGGYSHSSLYNTVTGRVLQKIVSFSPQNFSAVVDGIYRSIRRAHDNLVPGSVKIATGDLHGLGVNRSREAYGQNPMGERTASAGNTNSTMTLLRIASRTGTSLGALSWFALHGTFLRK